MYRWVYSLVQLGPSPFLQPNNVHAKYAYRQINYVRLRAIQISRQECQTRHYQHNSIIIRVKIETYRIFGAWATAADILKVLPH